MTPMELARELRAGKLANLYLLQGEERLTLEEALTALQNAVLAGGLADFNFDRFRGKETEASRLETALGTSPMMAPRRLVVVRDFDEAPEAAREAMVAFSKSPVPTTVFVAVAESPDARTSVYKALAKVAVTVKFEAPRESDLGPWCVRRGESLGVKVDDAAARRLVEVIGRDMGALKSAVERLALFVGDGGRVTAEHVDEAIVETREQSAFELCDAVGAGEAARAWGLARKLLAQREPPLRLMALLSRHYRQLTRLREAREKRVPREAAAGTLKMSPFAVRSLWPQTDKHTLEGLRRAFNILFEADRALKGSPVPADIVFERTIVSLARLAQSPRSR